MEVRGIPWQGKGWPPWENYFYNYRRTHYSCRSLTLWLGSSSCFNVWKKHNFITQKLSFFSEPCRRSLPSRKASVIFFYVTDSYCVVCALSNKNDL